MDSFQDGPRRDPKYAGFWVRFLASAIDLTLLSIATWFLELVILGLVYWVGHFSKSFTDAFTGATIQGVITALELTVVVGYFAWGHYRYGTTVGKKLFRVYVVSESNRLPISLKQAIVRSIAFPLSFVPLGAGFVMAAIHPEKRALHDLLAGTVTISKEMS